MNAANSDDDRDARFDEAVERYFDEIEANGTADQDRLLSDFPDLADSLRRFFTDNERMESLFGAVDEAASDRGFDEPTIPRTDRSLAPPSAAMNDQHAEDGAEAHQRIGEFELISKIAQGGMGVVYQARDLSLGRIVALKMIRAGVLADQEEIRRFHFEAEAAAKLDHPGIVPIYRIGVEQGRHYFTMPLVEGESLADKIRTAPLPTQDAARYVRDVAQAVHYAHQRGIIHRDLKPANVLLDTNDHVKVTDFGLAKQISAEQELTMTGQILGTASYMPPEQARADAARIGPLSDVYSLGAVLYALLTQQAPFVADNPYDVLLQVTSIEPVPPRRLRDTVPVDLETICLKCLNKEISGRYGSAAELAEDLDRFLEGRPILARPIDLTERLVRWCRRRPSLTAVMVLASLLAIAAPLAIYFGGKYRASADLIGSISGYYDPPRVTREDPAARILQRAATLMETVNSEETSGAAESMARRATQAMLDLRFAAPADAERSLRELLQTLQKNAATETPRARQLLPIECCWSATADVEYALGRLYLRMATQPGIRPPQEKASRELARQHLRGAADQLRQLVKFDPQNKVSRRRLLAVQLRQIDGAAGLAAEQLRKLAGQDAQQVTDIGGQRNGQQEPLQTRETQETQATQETQKTQAAAPDFAQLQPERAAGIIRFDPYWIPWTDRDRKSHESATGANDWALGSSPPLFPEEIGESEVLQELARAAEALQAGRWADAKESHGFAMGLIRRDRAPSSPEKRRCREEAVRCYVAAAMELTRLERCDDAWTIWQYAAELAHANSIDPGPTRETSQRDFVDSEIDKSIPHGLATSLVELVRGCPRIQVDVQSTPLPTDPMMLYRIVLELCSND